MKKLSFLFIVLLFQIGKIAAQPALFLFKNPLLLYNFGRVLDGNFKNYSAAKKYYSKYLMLAKPQSMDEKKAYDYIRRRYYKK